MNFGAPLAHNLKIYNLDYRLFCYCISNLTQQKKKQILQTSTITSSTLEISITNIDEYSFGPIWGLYGWLSKWSKEDDLKVRFYRNKELLLSDNSVNICKMENCTETFLEQIL